MKLHLARLSSPGGTTPSFCLVFTVPRGCVCVCVCSGACMCVPYSRSQCLWLSIYERRAKAVTQRQRGTVNCIKRQRQHFHPFRFSPSDTDSPEILPALPACRRTSATECFEARGKQVLKRHLCEKLQLNEGFTSYNQR